MAQTDNSNSVKSEGIKSLNENDIFFHSPDERPAWSTEVDAVAHSAPFCVVLQPWTLEPGTVLRFRRVPAGSCAHLEGGAPNFGAIIDRLIDPPIHSWENIL